MAFKQPATSMLTLPFLRPVALPRLSTLNHFLGVTKALTSSALTVSPSSTTSSSTAAQSLPYRVLRTPSKNLPIYLLAKRGGNLKQTRLKKIEGNINVLRTQLLEALGLDEKDVKINQLTKHIIVRGWKKTEITTFLEDRQF